MPAIGGAAGRRAQELTERREPFVRATVVRAQRPTSAHAGDTAVLEADGALDGFVGGACVESSVRLYGLQALAAGEPLLLRVVPGEPSRSIEEGAVEVANPCLSGGTVEIFLEPWLPPARVLVVGETPIAQALAGIGIALGLEMTSSDGTAPAPRADDAALIVASHGRGEEPALEAALRAGVPYVALVASATRGSAVLASLNVGDDDRARVFSPAGLDLGARTPGEIALSILAQLVSVRARKPAPAPAAIPAPGPSEAIDPVCRMTVAAVESTLHVDHNGTRSYFCSEACRASFLANPDRYAIPS